MKRQVYNPYLPLNVYIPDGEPHVFGDRVYVYGSHDAEGGQDFCVLDYEVWSAPVNDLSDWSCPGIAYRAKQDPDWRQDRGYAMYAPDCVQGTDGRYYLYYALSGGGLFTGPIHAAVSERPDGPFSYYGCVREPDGTPLNTFITFDPAVINDDGVIRLYYGWSLAVAPEQIPAGGVPGEQLRQVCMMLFGKTAEELDNTPEGVMGANCVELMDDMLTICSRPKRIAPGQFDARGTGFEGHAFFEGSSIRKIGSTYYFIYSSEHQHELCYATSRYPDRDFVYRGVLISNGDIGFQGRTTEDRLMMTGNNHGGIEKIGDRWFVFYHRQTHRNTFSRQGCAERIDLQPDGSIPQVQMTSCGLNGRPLIASGAYPASICCNLTNGHMPHAGKEETPEGTPNITHDGHLHLIANITNGTGVAYKYFAFAAETILQLTLRGNANGMITVDLDDEAQGHIVVSPSSEWITRTVSLNRVGTYTLKLVFHGEGCLDLLELSFS